MTRRSWTTAEVETMRRLYANTPTKAIAAQLDRPLSQVYRHAARLGLKKSVAYMASPAACRLRREGDVGKEYRFKKGHEPANKGLRRPGWAPGRMAETQFKKGVRQGVAIKLYQPIGTERLSKDGYLERKINDGMPLQRRWRAVHIVEWEKVNGPLPAGHCLIFRDGNKQNLALENLELLTRAQNMLRNSLHNYPKEIGDAIRARAVLNRRINHVEKHQ